MKTRKIFAKQEKFLQMINLQLQYVSFTKLPWPENGEGTYCGFTFGLRDSALRMLMLLQYT